MFVATNFHESLIERSRERPVVLAFIDGTPLLRQWVESVLAAQLRERDERIALVLVDVDRERQLATRYGVRMIPTVKGFRAGERVAGFIGVRPSEGVEAFVDALLAPTPVERLREELRAEREWVDVVAALDESDHERALELLLGRAKHGDRPRRERARQLMVALFGELGPEHPLSVRYRRLLAAALY